MPLERLSDNTLISSGDANTFDKSYYEAGLGYTKFLLGEIILRIKLWDNHSRKALS